MAAAIRVDDPKLLMKLVDDHHAVSELNDFERGRVCVDSWNARRQTLVGGIVGFHNRDGVGSEDRPGGRAGKSWHNYGYGACVQ